MSEDVILEVQKLNIAFQNEADETREETVVHDLDLTICRGDVVGLVGESGSGKTMTALAIDGLLSRHGMSRRGAILYKGTDLLTCDRAELRKIQGSQIGIVFQEPMTSLDPVRTIGWQLEEPLRLHTDLNPAQRHEKAVNALREVEMENPENICRRYPH